MSASDPDWLEWLGRVTVALPGPASRGELIDSAVCVECGCASLSMADHHLVCDCASCDMPSDERGLLAAMRRRDGDPN